MARDYKTFVKLLTIFFLNPLDWKLFTGNFQDDCPVDFPYTPGFDVAGRVVKPSGGFNVGDKIVCNIGLLESCKKPAPLPQGPCGALAKFVCVPAKECVRLKESTKFKQVAGLPLAGATAFQGLFGINRSGLNGQPLGDAKKGKRVLVLGGASGTGSLAVQMAKNAGCTVAATASSKPVNEQTDMTKCEMVEALGADVVIDYTKKDWIDVMNNANYDIIFDCVGIPEDLTERAPKALTKGGQFVSIANFNGESTDHVKYSVFLVKQDKQDLKALVDMIERKEIVVPVDSEYTFSEAKDAFKRSLSGHATGKILVKCG